MPRGCAILLLTLSTLTGLTLALLAVAFIIVNEGQADLAALARASRAIHPDDPAAPLGALVSLTGTIAADSPLGDDRLLAPGPYLRVERIVEMYAWERYRDGEDSNGKPHYNERQVWTRSPDSGLLGNPEMPFRGLTRTASSAHIGTVQVALEEAELPLADRLALGREHLLPGVEGILKDDYLYIGNGPTSRPRTGDLRVSYMVVTDGQLVTAFASLDGGRLTPYQASDGRAVLKILEGDREMALRDLLAVQVIAGWMVRLAAAAGLWVGLLLLFAGSRRLLDWPQLLGVTAGSARLATVLGLPAAALSVLSLWLSHGSLPALAAALAAEALLAGAWVLSQRARLQPAG